MFKAVIIEPKIFKALVNTIGGILTEAMFTVNKDGISLRGLDRSRITYIDMILKVDWFDAFSCDNEQTVTIDTEQLIKVMRRVRKDDVVELSSDESRLLVTFEGSSRRTFKIIMVDMEFESPPPPDLDFSASVMIPVEEFEGGIKDAEVFSEELAITLDNESIKLGTIGDMGDNSLEYLHGEKIDLKKPVTSRYTLEKLKEIIKSKDLAEDVILHVGESFPIKIDFGSDKAFISFLLAPRIDTEEE